MKTICWSFKKDRFGHLTGLICQKTSWSVSFKFFFVPVSIHFPMVFIWISQLLCTKPVKALSVLPVLLSASISISLFLCSCILWAVTSIPGLHSKVPWPLHWCDRLAPWQVIEGVHSLVLYNAQRPFFTETQLLINCLATMKYICGKLLVYFLIYPSNSWPSSLGMFKYVFQHLGLHFSYFHTLFFFFRVEKLLLETLQ